MTENLAGRGEGLAGLVAALKIATKELWHTQMPIAVNAAMPSVIPCVKDCVKCMCERALEAAAPPSTAPDFVQLGNDLGLSNYQVDRIKAWLATPSPQAPASMGVYVALHFDQEQHGWPRVAGVYSTYEAAENRVEELGCGATQSLQLDKPVRLAVPAATQEPAGSGMDGIDPSHDWRNILGLLKSTIGMCSDEEPHQAISANLWHAVHMVYVLYGVGSPRKVGEDGALEQQIAKLMAFHRSDSTWEAGYRTAAELVNRKHVPDIDECKTLRQAQALLSRYSEGHAQLGLRIKDVVDALAPSRQGAGGK